MRVRLRARAKQELRDAIAWYRERNEDVAERFKAEVRHTLEHLERFPISGGLVPGVIDDEVRRLPVHNFPYNVVFIRLHDHISVIAIAHVRGRPDTGITSVVEQH
jgi:plasmid stabilization system protein ParE